MQHLIMPSAGTKKSSITLSAGQGFQVGPGPDGIKAFISRWASEPLFSWARSRHPCHCSPMLLLISMKKLGIWLNIPIDLLTN